MEILKNYLLGYMSLIFASIAILMIAPENSIKKYLKYVIGLMVIGMLLNPITKIFNKDLSFIDLLEKAVDESNIYEYSIESETNELISEKILKNFNINMEEKIKRLIQEKFKDVETDVKVYSSTKGNEVIIDKIDLEINNNGVDIVKKVEIGIQEENTQIETPLESEIKEFIKKEINIENLVINIDTN